MAKEKAEAANKKTTGEQATKAKFDLSKYRPKRRVAVFGVFLALCICIFALYDTCNVGKKKEDCGYSGISAFECRTTACFLKGGGEMEKLKITVNRTKGTKLGLTFEEAAKKKSSFIVESIKDGAVKDHNAVSDMRLQVQDVIISVDGSSEVAKTLKKTDTTKVVLNIRRSKLPGFLRSWIHRGGKPGRVETVLTAPRFINWLRTSSNLGGVGMIFWFLSGYPLASLPFYYFGLSAAVGWHLNKCCHDSHVPGGVPHCYKGASSTVPEAMSKIWEYASSTMKRVQTKGLSSYAKWLLEPPKISFR